MTRSETRSEALPAPEEMAVEPLPATATVVDEEETAEISAPPAARNGANLATEARQVLSQLLQTMGFDADVSVRSSDSPITLAVNGDNLGVLIGRRGDNLAALQFMVNLILSKNRRQWPRVVVDVENYRARREESLRSLAERIGYRVRRNGKPYTLEAMPASDRRIIHLTLRDRSDVETYSIGEGPARRVVIAPKRGERAGVERGYSSSAYRP
jgi:spoIIIJ-associated protein